MKKILVVAAIIVLIVGILTVSSIAADSKVIEVNVEGVPTLLLPADGAQVFDGKGESWSVVTLVPKEQINLIPVDDFDKEQTSVYNKYLETADKREICDNLQQVVDSIDPGADAREYTHWEAFAFSITGDAAPAFRADDSRYIEFSFKCEVSNEEDPIVVMSYADGKWTAIDDALYEIKDGVLRVRLNKEGIVTLLYKRNGSVTSSVVRGSVQIKDVPQVINEDEDNVFPIWDNKSNDRIIFDIPAEDILLTSAAALEGESKLAYLDLAETESISALCPGFMDTAKKIDPLITEDQLVIKDVFEFRLTGESENRLDAEDDNNVVLDFKYSINEGDFFMVLEYVDGKWVALDPEFCWAENDKVSVRLCNDGLIAFVVKEQ